MARKNSSAAISAPVMSLPGDLAARVAAALAPNPTGVKVNDNFTVTLDRIEFRDVNLGDTPAVVARNVYNPKADGSKTFELHSTPMTLTAVDDLIVKLMVARHRLEERINRRQPPTGQFGD